MKRKVYVVLLCVLGFLLTLYLILYIYFDFERVSLFVYLKFCGAKIINQKESPDGNLIISTVRINRNNVSYELTLSTRHKNFKVDPIYIDQIENKTIVHLLFDSVSQANYQKKHPQNYFPSFCSSTTGITLDKSGTNKLFPFRIHNIQEAFDNIGKIDSVFKSIPLYPGVLMVRIDKSQKVFYSRTNIKQSQDALENLKKKIGYDIFNSKEAIK